ncbi:DNA-binding death effector domain-containing protein 2 isoform X1 [Ambystoma mexicanum]|uniref:DNA-binding death effector domain-containing protein 2 isoform X1 n=1 Tax=Ambystoma mexicanum TaxID=8296 RepID=UPI0037E71401
MSVLRRPAYSQSWEEDDCLEYYGMFSLHQMFEVIGTHLTENDMEVLSFLLDETHPLTHPLDPEVWAIEDEEGEAIDERQQGALLAAWQRLNRCSGARSRDYSSGERLDANIPRVKNGVQLLLELERRGKCDEYNFTHLLQLLRVLTRHDLLQYVTLKRPRTVSPERFTYGPSVNYSEQKVDGCLNSSSTQGDNCEGGSVSNKRMKVNRGRKGRATSKRRGCKAKAARKEEQAKTKVTCGIRLRVRAEYCNHQSILSQNVLSNKQNRLEKQFDVFSQSNTVLKARDLGSIICQIKFSELSYLDAFWNDYMNGSLLEALKGVFITDSLKQAVGQEAIQLLVSVDEDDYEEGRKVLLENIPL